MGGTHWENCLNFCSGLHSSSQVENLCNRQLVNEIDVFKLLWSVYEWKGKAQHKFLLHLLFHEMSFAHAGVPQHLLS